MKDKNYVVISGPTRESMGSMMSGGLIATSYSYRRGDLGLIHPSIVGFWKNFHENYFKGHLRGVKTISAHPSSRGLGLYSHEKDDVPILLFKGNLSDGGSYYNENWEREYFIVPLKEREFNVLERTSLGEVRNEVKGIHGRMHSGIFTLPERVERELQEQWKKLALFHPGNPKIYDIPIEVSERKISQERIKGQEQLQKTLRELEQWRRESLDSKFIFDRTIIGACV